MSTDIQTSIAILRASVTEGRAENVRYRQNQLHALHAALRTAADAVCQAIAEDEAAETAEVETEFYLAVDALKQAYASLDFEKCLENEYLVANGKDNVERRVALGFVAIRPLRHSRFYSVLTSLVAALSAGNCVLLEVSALLVLQNGADYRKARRIIAKC
jgi:acyl-CoA reductase-like NAD-dependent aldehyde dehydrogenase